MKSFKLGMIIFSIGSFTTPMLAGAETCSVWINCSLGEYSPDTIKVFNESNTSDEFIQVKQLENQFRGDFSNNRVGSESQTCFRKIMAVTEHRAKVEGFSKCYIIDFDNI